MSIVGDDYVVNFLVVFFPLNDVIGIIVVVVSDVEELFDASFLFDVVDRGSEHNHSVFCLGLIVITETLLAFLVELFHHQYHLTVYYLVVVIHGAISLSRTVFDLASSTSGEQHRVLFLVSFLRRVTFLKTLWSRCH